MPRLWAAGIKAPSRTRRAPSRFRQAAGGRRSLAPTMAGRHKIFLGMAAGVGNTYRMLQEGQAEAEMGRDVVVGVLETHGRRETVAVAEGLELVPRRAVDYRGAVLQELDLPA